MGLELDPRSELGPVFQLHKDYWDLAPSMGPVQLYHGTLPKQELWKGEGGEVVIEVGLSWRVVRWRLWRGPGGVRWRLWRASGRGEVVAVEGVRAE